MPRRSREYAVPPQDWLREGAWPHGAFDREAPEILAYAVAIATALGHALGAAGRSKSQVAAEAEVERSTLYDVLAGRVWPDTVTLAKLERVLDAQLWPTAYPPRLRRVSGSRRSG